jgi:alkylation response protein AidB-like acyl-CoA dehydrogenase
MTRRLADVVEAEERREAVRNAATVYLKGEWSLAQLRACLDRDGVADAPQLWSGMQRLDWDQVEPFRPRADSDATSELGFGTGEFCALVEETGRALAPTPLVPCVVGRAVLRGVGAGATPAFPVLAHAEAERSSDRLRTSVTASRTDAGHRLDGAKRFVPYGLHADLAIVNATQEDGTQALFAIDPETPGVERTALTLLDASPCAELRLNAAEVPRTARVASGDAARRLLGDALALETLAHCAELVGVASRALDLAVEYAKQRVAFDRPIGSFQAIQHALVDLRGRVEVARALYQGAAAMAPDLPEERDVAVAMAAFAALDDLRRVPEGALQVFGGIGTTWDHDIHFFVRRAATLCALLGERSGFREVVARHLASAS